ncbi:DUF4012 domain-containing protein [Candidatus Uhrbacteria bacterium]|nr:DUF4012 domain-containing protein [Candidatus Uhrbacteria bacterium]
MPEPSTKERTANAPGVPHTRSIYRSPHLLDLTPPAEKQPEGTETLRNARRIAWRRALDERLHLRDLKNPTLSNRPRGWRDFPDRDAKTVGQALKMAVVRFFREHPLADLTVLTAVHLTAAVVWQLVARPDRTDRPKREKAALCRMPLLARPSRPVLSFAVAGIILALGLMTAPPMWRMGKTGLERTVLTAKSGASRLLMAGEAIAAGNLDRAQWDFETAADDFTQAKSSLGRIGLTMARMASVLPIDSPVTVAGPLLIAGESLAKAGVQVTATLSALETENDPSPLKKLNGLRDGLKATLPHLETAESELGKVRPESLPEEYRQAIVLAQENLPKATAEIRRGLKATELIGWMMGSESSRRYLLIFQNNAEIRPTGGFIGSFAVLDIDRGQVTGLDIPGGGSYDLQGGLQARLVSPQPFHLIRAGWEFQDANWFADFPSSAKKLAWFLERSGGPTVDGVIALTATTMEDILETVGPISMPEYGKTVDHRNFWFETQRQVEENYDREGNRPKQFIADLAPKLIEKALASDRTDLIRLMSVLDDSLSRKEIQLWFDRDEPQAMTDELGWDGRIRPTEGDYLSIVHTNIAGQKTDLMMRDRADHSVRPAADGSATVTLTLERTHTGMKGAMFSGVRNVDFVRFYVPEGSELVEAKGFRSPDPKLFGIPEPDRKEDADIAASESGMTVDGPSGVRTFRESGKTVFGGWLQTDPGNTTVATLTYRLPVGTLKASEDGTGKGRILSHSLLIQRQSGTNPTDFSSRLDLPDSLRLIDDSPKRERDERGRWLNRFTMDRDVTLRASIAVPEMPPI